MLRAIYVIELTEYYMNFTEEINIDIFIIIGRNLIPDI